MAAKQKIRIKAIKKTGKILLTLFFCFVLSACSKQDKPQSDNNPVLNKVLTKDWAEEWSNSAMNLTNQEHNNLYMMFDGKEHLIIGPYVIMDIETGEQIDLRTGDKIKHSGEKFGGLFERERYGGSYQFHQRTK